VGNYTALKAAGHGRFPKTVFRWGLTCSKGVPGIRGSGLTLDGVNERGPSQCCFLRPNKPVGDRDSRRERPDRETTIAGEQSSLTAAGNGRPLVKRVQGIFVTGHPARRSEGRRRRPANVPHFFQRATTAHLDERPPNHPPARHMRQFGNLYLVYRRHRPTWPVARCPFSGRDELPAGPKKPNRGDRGRGPGKT